MNNDLFTFTFTRDQLSVISQALYDMPYKTASPILQDMQRQIDAAAVEKAQHEEALKAAAEDDKVQE